MEFKVLFVYIKVNLDYNLKRQKGFSARMNMKAGGELQQKIIGQFSRGSSMVSEKIPHVTEVCLEC